MFTNFGKRLQPHITDLNKFDPSCGDDPIAARTKWTPTTNGGFPFSTHNLVRTNPFRLEFRANWGIILLDICFLLWGTGLLLSTSVPIISSGEFSIGQDMAISLLFGFILTIAVSASLSNQIAPIVFDKRIGYFWKGWKTPYETTNKNPINNCYKLDNIHAIQIISKFIPDLDISYFSYELNLALENGERINVIGHGDKEKLKKHAKTLSVFLDKPVWDARSWNGTVNLS